MTFMSLRDSIFLMSQRDPVTGEDEFAPAPEPELPAGSRPNTRDLALV